MPDEFREILDVHIETSSPHQNLRYAEVEALLAVEAELHGLAEFEGHGTLGLVQDSGVWAGGSNELGVVLVSRVALWSLNAKTVLIRIGELRKEAILIPKSGARGILSVPVTAEVVGNANKPVERTESQNGRSQRRRESKRTHQIPTRVDRNHDGKGRGRAVQGGEFLVCRESRRQVIGVVDSLQPWRSLSLKTLQLGTRQNLAADKHELSRLFPTKPALEAVTARSMTKVEKQRDSIVFILTS
ncbi:hypothetical protein JAAARDRAFT_79813 [Jaapia argillacea MUCL 33604]|uniref:Uncharacterized protein n=1 Tax=Jaapia argillacea MUCL 33604 TaxID=933084 RepID=A0A067PYG7_9AGAM|nr:hypothetical protein JAAARDRAFT_79813 [Jaapia argillacea MUCL 33604]